MAITSMILLLLGGIMLWNGHRQNKVNAEADAKARESKEGRKRLNRHAVMYRKR
ncbi:hypothetical protein [uncultured Aquitalea sp.]|uniref:hypothetical protein n=1 Tax=uncultured Aquitalea sp. TaxID=540272 RepID=UPI0025F77959|nr:hypothetical protein [uncultured Aquitalea sp.]